MAWFLTELYSFLHCKTNLSDSSYLNTISFYKIKSILSLYSKTSGVRIVPVSDCIRSGNKNTEMGPVVLRGT